MMTVRDEGWGGPGGPRGQGGWCLSLPADQFGCLAWSHSETHLLYVAEKKRPKAESFFQSKAPEQDCSTDEDMACPEKPDAPLKVGPQHPRADGSAPRGWH